MARLIDIVQGLPPDTLRRLSRLRIEYGPATAAVVMHVAGMRRQEAQGLHPLPSGGMEARQIPRGLVSITNKAGVAARNPPVKLMAWDAWPDVESVIDVADLDAQIAELHDSRVVGRLNVIRHRRYALLITSAGSEAERGAWVRCIDLDGSARPRYDEASEALQYVAITGSTYRHRRRIINLAARDGGFARWHKASQSWRAQLTPESIKALQALRLEVDAITTTIEDDACTTSPTSL